MNRLVGSSAAINNLRRVIERVGPANSRILISGPAGAGKELAARLIHDIPAAPTGRSCHQRAGHGARTDGS